jgi:hypothetical protein
MAGVLVFILGLVAGGYATRDVQPRSFLAVDRCDHCWSPSELAGLLGSIGVQRLGGHLPLVVLETNRTIVMRIPTLSRRGQHYVAGPKRDIRDPAHLAPDDVPYLVDAFAVMGRLVRDRGLHRYRIVTRGPGDQSVNYLHFHLFSDDYSAMR